MADPAPRGRLWPKAEDEPEWFDHPHPGVVVRLARAGGKEQFLTIPLERTLEEVLAWAAVEFNDPTRPETMPGHAASPSTLASPRKSSRRT